MNRCKMIVLRISPKNSTLFSATEKLCPSSSLCTKKVNKPYATVPGRHKVNYDNYYRFSGHFTTTACNRENQIFQISAKELL